MSNKIEPAILQIGEKRLKLPIIAGSTGPNVMDIRQLYSQTDTFTFDPETSKFTYRPVQELSQGKHTLKLQVRDLEGNLSVPVASNFTIDLV